MFKPARLIEIRENKNLKQKELAEKTGLSRNVISAYERGLYAPGSHAQEVIACFFCVPIDYFHKAKDDDMPFDYISLPENSPPGLKKDMKEYLEYLKIKYDIKTENS